MISLLFGVCYGEFLWRSYLNGRITLVYIRNSARALAAINYVLSILVSSMASFEIGVIISLYGLVIFDLRESKLKGENSK